MDGMRILYHLPLSPFSRKVRLALAEKRIPFELRLEKVWDQREEFLAMNPAGTLRHYPGSPFLAERVMREQDRLRLFELHPTEGKILDENIRRLEAHAAANGGCAHSGGLLPMLPGLAWGPPLLGPQTAQRRLHAT